MTIMQVYLGETPEGVLDANPQLEPGDILQVYSEGQQGFQQFKVIVEGSEKKLEIIPDPSDNETQSGGRRRKSRRSKSRRRKSRRR